jgi:hypothetical protein
MPRKHNDVVAVLQAGLHVLGRHAAKFRVVASNIEVLDAGLAETSVDNGDPGSGFLDVQNRIGQRLGFERKHDECVDLMDRNEIFQGTCLGARVRRVHEDEVNVRIEPPDVFRPAPRASSCPAAQAWVGVG